jgi:hypothetical protein
MELHLQIPIISIHPNICFGMYWDLGFGIQLHTTIFNLAIIHSLNLKKSHIYVEYIYVHIAFHKMRTILNKVYPRLWKRLIVVHQVFYFVDKCWHCFPLLLLKCISWMKVIRNNYRLTFKYSVVKTIVLFVSFSNLSLYLTIFGWFREYRKFESSMVLNSLLEFIRISWWKNSPLKNK